MQLRTLAAVLAVAVMTPATAQDLATRMATESHVPDVSRTGRFGVEVDALTFFKDNEFGSEHARGYTLPGVRLQPTVSYQPLPQVRLQAGFNALIYDGAGKYPCYAYHDIGRWKGNQYQRGAHVLPFFRVQAQMGCVQVVMGNIFGGANHRLLEAIYNPEVNLTQDPEAGFQLMVDASRYRMDAWVAWQSYIFEEDTHQEAFTIGVSQRIALTDTARRWHAYIPVDVLAQHRGGEQDITDMGVQTLVNGAVGAGLRWRAGSRLLRTLTAEAALLGSWQQSGHLWPFDTGWGGSVDIGADLSGGFHLKAGFMAARRFAALYAVPFHSTVSQKHEGARYSHTAVPHVALEWCRAFADDYQFGVKLDAYPTHSGRLTMADGTTMPAAWHANFAFGAYMRCRPRW